MAAYRRKQTRAPRQVEQITAAIERDQLQDRLATLTGQTRATLGRNMELESIVRIRDLEVEKLLHDKIKLARELDKLNRHIAFLEGKGEPSFYASRRFYGS